jgi:CMP-N-acetylneuraminic acid synthetase
MNLAKDKVWAIIPARGGSKSIPLKNLVKLAGRPLLDYVTQAAKASKEINRIILSTDNQEIANFSLKSNIEVHPRPKELSMDNTPVLEVFINLLEDIGKREGEIPEFLLILQPTSPFVLPAHIDNCIKMLKAKRNFDSAQTISTLPHAFHAYNQRIIENGVLRFRFTAERRSYYNKQTKPLHYVFGNIIVTKSDTILNKRDIFGDASLPLIIPFPYATDVDGQAELEMAEWLIKSGKVSLPFLK